MNELSTYQTLAAQMIATDKGRDKMLDAMDAMWQAQWSLPESLDKLGWMRKVVSTDPHDAIRAGTRVLSSVAPRIRVQPLGIDEASRAQADTLERALGWHFAGAGRNRRASALRDIVLSALLYDEVVAQVVYLPHQNEISGQATPRAQTQPFNIIVRNPREVHVAYGDNGIRAVLHKRVQGIDAVLETWGERATAVYEALHKKGNDKVRYVSVFDYMDSEMRVVWARLGEDATLLDAEGDSGDMRTVEIMREAHGLPFLPWVAQVGGTTLFNDPAHQRVPMLYSVYQAGQWDTQNILESLLASESIAYAAAPRFKVEGPTDYVEIDYGEPARPAFVPPGHDLHPLNPPALDTALLEIASRVGERISKSTVPRVLQNGDLPASTPFATLNLATQTGIKALTPYKELAESALAEILTHMLRWVAQGTQPLLAYGQGRDDRGLTYQLTPERIPIDQLVIDVELTADIPTDRMARINAASVAVRDLGLSRQRALEQIGVNDPLVAMEERALEDQDAARVAHQKQSSVDTQQSVALGS